MSYSRRQLYAMGEPLGDSATYRKADGGLVLGGGGSSPAPSSTTVSSTELPDWAKGYAKDTLANAANLTDINKNPYQTYSQPRIAGFAPMQEQAQNPRMQPQPISAHDPVETLASQLSPRSAAWVRSHPEFARNERLTQKMIAAHNFVTADGMQPDTDEYFETVERLLGVRAPTASVEAAEAPMSAAAAPAQRRSSPAAAPVSRSGTGTGGGGPNVVRLSADEREMAKMMNMTAEEYARNKLALIKDGKLTKEEIDELGEMLLDITESKLADSVKGLLVGAKIDLENLIKSTAESYIDKLKGYDF